MDPTESQTPAERKISPNLRPFKAGDARTIELARIGGKVRSPEKRIQAMLSRYKRENAKAYAQYADISPEAAIALMKVFLDRGRYRDFLASEMFELLGATQGNFQYTMMRTTRKLENGQRLVFHDNEERKEAIRLKMKSIELLLKAGKAFFPEMRENGSIQAVQINVDKLHDR